MKDTSLYLALAAVVVTLIGVVWCFTAGPCGGNSMDSNPVTDAISTVLAPSGTGGGSAF